MATSDLKGCDLIMKGGVTSGVVYPLALTELAKHYRFFSVGGTSAGAIAAVVAAAAEYRRQRAHGAEDALAGFKEIESLPGELSGDRLFRLFQPTAELTRLFRVVVRLYSGSTLKPVWLRAIWVALTEDWMVSLGGALLACGSFVWAYREGQSALGLWLVTVIAAATIIVVALRLYRDMTVRLEAADFGMCPGIKTGHGLDRRSHKEDAPVRAGETTDPAFGEWLHETIERVAGPGRASILTVGDLATVHGKSAADRKLGVSAAAMTTDLSSQRPYQLPLQVGIHWFRKSDFYQVIPSPVVDYLVEGADDRTFHIGQEDVTLHRLKCGDAFPVFLIARMSLSFPGLISAVPLFRETEDNGIRRCLFTDGGMSSNFPVHFFDSTLPRRPTFGISLGSVTKPNTGDKPGDRVFLPMPPTYDEWIRRAADPELDLPVGRITGLGKFLMALLTCAKDWQDTLQSRLPGFRERIVRVNLRDSEGGLNLRMDKPTVDRLASYGAEAGRRLAGFDFDKHRNLRALVALPMLRESGASIHRAFTEGPVAGDFEKLLREPVAEAPDDFNNWRKDNLVPFANQLIDAADSLPDRMDDLPHADAALRVVAKPDLVAQVALRAAAADPAV